MFDNYASLILALHDEVIAYRTQKLYSAGLIMACQHWFDYTGNPSLSCVDFSSQAMN